MKNDNTVVMKSLSRQEVLDLGFKELPHFTIMGSLTYDLGRLRQLSLSSIGTPNEMLWIVQIADNKMDITDLICLNNYDYDGYMTKIKLENLIVSLTLS